MIRCILSLELLILISEVLEFLHHAISKPSYFLKEAEQSIAQLLLGRKTRSDIFSYSLDLLDSFSAVTRVFEVSDGAQVALGKAHLSCYCTESFNHFICLLSDDLILSFCCYI